MMMGWLKKILGIEALEAKLVAYEEVLKQMIVEVKELRNEIDQKQLFITNKLVEINLELNKAIKNSEYRIKRYIGRKLKKE
jgi:diketogulonate reductase-like aldo/keto reductase